MFKQYLGDITYTHTHAHTRPQTQTHTHAEKKRITQIVVNSGIFNY